MTAIVVTEEQVEIIKNSPTGVEIRSPKGERLGVFTHHGVSEEDIRIALDRRASTSPRYTTAEVLAYLRSLEGK